MMRSHVSRRARAMPCTNALYAAILEFEAISDEHDALMAELTRASSLSAETDEYPDPSAELDAARGMMLGVAIGVASWIVIVVIVLIVVTG